jgi:hypothetical protein
MSIIMARSSIDIPRHKVLSNAVQGVENTHITTITRKKKKNMKVPTPIIPKMMVGEFL